MQPDGGLEHAGTRNAIAEARSDDSSGTGRKRRVRFLLRGLVLLALGALSFTTLALAAIQTGLGDRVLADRVRSVLADTSGPDLVSSLGSVSVRIGSDGRIAIEADALRLSQPGQPEGGDGNQAGLLGDGAGAIGAIETIRLVLKPLPLVFGELKVERIDIDGAVIDAGLFANVATQTETLRVSALSDIVENGFLALDRAYRVLADSDTQAIRLTDARISGVAMGGGVVAVDALELSIGQSGEMLLAGAATIAGQEIDIEGSTEPHPELTTLDRFDLTLKGIERLGNDSYFTVAANGPDNLTKHRFGVESATTVSFRAERSAKGDTPALQATLDMKPGRATLGGDPSHLGRSWIALAYLPGDRKIEILPSRIALGESSFPFSGGVIDGERLDPPLSDGMAIEVIANGARTAPVDSAEKPVEYSARASGRFLPATARLVFDEMTVASGEGTLHASSAVTFGNSSPEISFAGYSDRMTTTGVKQLWPSWVASKPRSWAHENLFGGIARDVSIEVFIPAGRMAERHGEDLALDERQLNVGFAFEDMRVSLAGDIPPLRGGSGRLALSGDELDVAFSGATAYFPSGRTVEVTGGTFAIDAIAARPLMGEIDLDIEGSADAVAELASVEPIAVLGRTGLRPEDFAGPVEAEVAARFGLVRAHDPPEPEWNVALRLDGVTLAKPIAGRTMADVTGTAVIDPSSADVSVDALIDGMALHIDLRQPFADGVLRRELAVTGTLDGADLAALAPGLTDIVAGEVGLTLREDAKDAYYLDLDLTDAELSVPGLDWQKAGGIGARAVMQVGFDEGAVRIAGLSLIGDGFEIGGRLDIVEGALSSARFAPVRLAPGDDYRVALDAVPGGYAIDVTGQRMDVRSLIEGLRERSGDGEADAGPALSVTADVATVKGFNGETLSGFSLRYDSAPAGKAAFEMKGVTRSGQAAVAALRPGEDGTTLSLNTADLGALARFADVYTRLSGGVAELQMRKSGDAPYAGQLRLRDFSVINEAQLQALVSARAGGARESLNDAVNGQINASAAQFERGYARLEYGDGQLTVTDGAVRGPQIGTTFQGTVVDGNGQMAMTGTFMPAYGLNRLFGEIPLIGALLGNGRDRGLLGITFRLAGPVDDPQLTVNPISVMAPGIFRQIFEF